MRPVNSPSPVDTAKSLDDLLSLLRQIAELVSVQAKYVTLVVEQTDAPEIIIPVATIASRVSRCGAESQKTAV